MVQGGIAITPDGELILHGIDQLSALDGNGLKLTDDSGTLGVFVKDGGLVGIGTAVPIVNLHIDGGAANVEISLKTDNSGPDAGDGFSIQLDTAGNAYLWNREAGDIYFGTTGTTRMRLDADKAVLYILDSVNTKMAAGLTINQADADDEILAFKSSDIAHGLVGYAETDTYGLIMKSQAGDGGVMLRSLCADVAVSTNFNLYAFGGTADTTKSTAGLGLITFLVTENSGGGALANVTANGNLLAIRGRAGGGNLTAWLVDVDGDTWQSGNITCEHASAPNVVLTDTTNTQQTKLAATNTIGWVGTLSAHDFTINTGEVQRIYCDHATGSIYIGDTGNTNMGVGVTINQGAGDNEILALKSSDVAHAYVALTETDTYGYIKKAAAGQGGLEISAIAVDDNVRPVLNFNVRGGQAGTTHGDAAVGLLNYYIGEHDGANAAANITADGVLFTVRAYTGGGWHCKWHLDEDGDTWQAGGILLESGSYSAVTWGDGGEYLYGDNATASIIFVTTSTERVRILDKGLFINETANTKMTIGLTINQAANDNAILAFKSSDVTHGMTTFEEADTYGTFQKLSVSAGGVDARGWSSGTLGYLIGGYVTTVITTKSTAGDAPIILEGALRSGTSLTTLSANANIVCIRNFGTTIWIVDEDGDTWQNGAITALGSITLTGAIIGATSVAVTAAAGGYRSYLYQTTGSLRWMTSMDNSAEGGSNVGSDWNLFHYSDAAGYLGVAIRAYRASGQVTIYKKMFVGNETVNTKCTLGLTINQGANDNEILAFKSSDVAHAYVTGAETDTYASFHKSEATSGGLYIKAYKDADGSNHQAFRIDAHLAENVNTTKSTAGVGIMHFFATQTSGDALANVVANGNLLSIACRKGAANPTVWILDEDGDTWQTGALMVGGGTPTFINTYEIHIAQQGSGNAYMKWTNDTTGHTQADGFEIGLDSGENVYIWHREAEYMYLGGAIIALGFYCVSVQRMSLSSTLLTMSVPILPKDHGAAATPEVVAVVYGTGAPPAASGTPIGTLWVKYTA